MKIKDLIDCYLIKIMTFRSARMKMVYDYYKCLTISVNKQIKLFYF